AHHRRRACRRRDRTGNSHRTGLCRARWPPDPQAAAAGNPGGAAAAARRGRDRPAAAPAPSPQGEQETQRTHTTRSGAPLCGMYERRVQRTWSYRVLSTHARVDVIVFRQFRRMLTGVLAPEQEVSWRPVPTIYEVARRAGVSTATVSRVLS